MTSWQSSLSQRLEGQGMSVLEEGEEGTNATSNYGSLLFSMS